ncbi:aldo/keto reductase [Candidatus Woesearchaeota archaeon]|nr:aldo/keto reductase [Candidatus Woesearchaeota archaeon]
MKLALGTVQFGMDYGINNRGKIPKKEVFEILGFAKENGIDVLDTAYAYGSSESVIGEFISKTNNSFKIVSKLPSKNWENAFEESAKRLNSEKVYACLIHDFDSFLENPQIFDKLKILKQKGKIEKIGFSLYYPKEVLYLLDNNVQFDIVQVPFNIFDQRFSSVFELLKEKGVEIHVRSVFLQGLFFKNPAKLEGDFVKIKDKLSDLRSISERTGIPISALCINFALLNQDIDKVIIGVDSLENLQENIDSSKYKKKVNEVYGILSDLKEDDEGIILPINWN